jgi:hypothetical protein
MASKSGISIWLACNMNFNKLDMYKRRVLRTSWLRYLKRLAHNLVGGEPKRAGIIGRSSAKCVPAIGTTWTRSLGTECTSLLLLPVSV